MVDDVVSIIKYSKIAFKILKKKNITSGRPGIIFIMTSLQIHQLSKDLEAAALEEELY